MSTLRTCLRVAAAHRLYLLIYLVLISSLGLFTGMSAAPDPADDVTRPHPVVAVIDRDGSALSQALEDYTESVGEAEELEDSVQALQDATARGSVSYILIIPSGWGEAVASAAAAGDEPPALETVTSYRSADGSLVDLQVSTYVHHLQTALATGMPDADAAAIAEESSSAGIEAELLVAEQPPLPAGLLVFARFSLYPLLAYTVVSVSTVMSALQRRSVRSRILSSPTTAGSRSLGLLGACLLLGLVGWLWISSLGVLAFAGGSLATAAPLLAVVGLALLSFALFAVAVGFLLGQAGVGDNACHAVANIGGMALSFLGGAWIPQELMPEAVRAISRLTPGYWASEAVIGAGTTSSTSWQALAPFVGYCGVCALFAVATACVGLLIGRNRVRAAL